MAGKRKVHTAAFKAQVALAALKGDRTANEVASHYGVHPTLIHGWKKQLLAGAEAAFQPQAADAADAADGAGGRLSQAEAVGRRLGAQGVPVPVAGRDH